MRVRRAYAVSAESRSNVRSGWRLAGSVLLGVSMHDILRAFVIERAQAQPGGLLVVLILAAIIYFTFSYYMVWVFF